MKSFALSYLLLVSASSGFASELSTQDACLANASETLAQANSEAQATLDKKSARCFVLPAIDAVNECVNDALAAYEQATKLAYSLYQAEVKSCL